MDSSVLSTADQIHAADPGDMLKRIKDLPTQVREAWRITGSAALHDRLRGARDITVAGMGGSAIGGELVAALLLDDLRVPMAVHRDYGLPGYVGSESLVIVSSFSGNTEETLSAFAEARRRRAKVLAVTTGGKVAELAKSEGIPLVTFDYKAQPRAALGYSLGLVLSTLEKLDYVRGISDQVEPALQDVGQIQARVDESGATNDAKQLAIELAGHVPVTFGAGVMAVMARRVKDQWNENAKNWSSYDTMSELNHNAVVGFPNPAIARDALRVLLLRSDRDNPRHRLRFDITADLLDRAHIVHRTLAFPGQSMLSEVLQLAYFTDYVSFYLALLNGADPSEVRSIDYLKDQLAN
jgi:glucose/mannose-6-phosphate isomerase